MDTKITTKEKVMNMKNIALVAFGIAVLSGTAFAEMISGTITAIDPTGQKVTLMRSDTNDSVTVNVKDADSFASLRTGSTITLDAQKKFLGGWEAASVDASAANATDLSSDLPSAANSANSNSSINSN